MGYLITSPSGKPMRIAQFSLGSTDTTTRKPAGALAYKGGYLYLSNGTYWVRQANASSGGSVGNADSLGGVPASDYARLSVANTFTDNNTFAKDTNYFGSSGNNAVVNFWDEANGVYAPITMQESIFDFGAYNIQTSEGVTAGSGTFNLVTTPQIYSASGGGLKISNSNPYSTLVGNNMTKNALDGYVNIFGTNIYASRQTTGGFGYSNSQDTIFYGHATISHNVPIALSESNDSTANEESSQLWLYTRKQGDTASYAFGVRKTRDGYTGTANLFLKKYRGLLDANQGRWDYNKYLQFWSTDSSNNFRFNSDKASTETYGNVIIDNGNFLVNGTITGGATAGNGTTAIYGSSYYTGTTQRISSSGDATLVAITATGLMTLGSSGSAQAHQISSASANALTLYRPQTSVGAASGLNFAGNTSNGTQVTYGTIQGLLQSASNSLQSGGLQFAVRKGGVEVKALILDSLANAGLQVQNTSTLSDTRFWIRSSGLSLYALSVIPAASTTKQFAVDTSGNIRNIGAVATSGLFGVAPFVDTVNYSAVASSIASKNLTATAGMYRISYNLFTRTAGTGGTAQMTLSFNNGNAQTMTSAAINLNSANSMDDDVFVYTVASGTPTVLVTVTGATGSPTYTFRANVERLQ